MNRAFDEKISDPRDLTAVKNKNSAEEENDDSNIYTGEEICSPEFKEGCISRE